jgi:transcriptional regulator with XRE-family HTH domain
MDKRGISQIQIAALTGIEATRMHRIVRGKVVASSWEIGAIADVLEVDLTDLLGVSAEKAQLNDQIAQLQQDLSKRSIEAAASAEQFARKAEAASRAQVELLDAVMTLRSQLHAANEARAIAEAEAARLRSELEACSELESKDGHSRGPGRRRRLKVESGSG